MELESGAQRGGWGQEPASCCYHCAISPYANMPSQCTNAVQLDLQTSVRSQGNNALQEGEIPEGVIHCKKGQSNLRLHAHSEQCSPESWMAMLLDHAAAIPGCCAAAACCCILWKSCCIFMSCPFMWGRGRDGGGGWVSATRGGVVQGVQTAVRVPSSSRAAASTTSFFEGQCTLSKTVDQSVSQNWRSMHWCPCNAQQALPSPRPMRSPAPASCPASPPTAAAACPGASAHLQRIIAQWLCYLLGVL